MLALPSRLSCLGRRLPVHHLRWSVRNSLRPSVLGPPRQSRLPTLRGSVLLPVASDHHLRQQRSSFATVSSSSEVTTSTGTAEYDESRFDEDSSDWEPPSILYSRARTGDVDAMFKYAMYCTRGNHPDVEQDHDEAVEWLEKAAEQNHTLAQVRLGTMYMSGYGVEKDVRTAYRYLIAAAKKNNNNAQHRLARMYRDGDGVKKDTERALRWMLAAAENGHVRAQYEYSLMCLDTVPGFRNTGQQFLFEEKELRLSKEQITIIQEALRWLVQAAQGEDQDAGCLLGVILCKGELGIPVNVKEGAKWLRKAAMLGNKNAQYNMGLFYMHGLLERNPGFSYMEEAAYWFEKATLQGHVRAQMYLGFMYYHGDGVDRDIATAVKWWTVSAAAVSFLFPVPDPFDLIFFSFLLLSLCLGWSGKTERRACTVHAGDDRLLR